MIESNFITKDDNINIDDIRKMLIMRFNEIDFNDAKKDVIPFVKDTSVLDIWSKEFFISITEQLKANE